MYEKTFKSAKKMTNGNHVTHNTKHTILINKTKFTPYSVPPAHVPASVKNEKSHSEHGLRMKTLGDMFVLDNLPKSTFT